MARYRQYMINKFGMPYVLDLFESITSIKVNTNISIVSTEITKNDDVIIKEITIDDLNKPKKY